MTTSISAVVHYAEEAFVMKNCHIWDELSNPYLPTTEETGMCQIEYSECIQHK